MLGHLVNLLIIVIVSLLGYVIVLKVTADSTFAFLTGLIVLVAAIIVVGI